MDAWNRRLLNSRIEGQRRDAVRAAVDLLAHQLRETEYPGDLARAGQHLEHVLKDWLADLNQVRDFGDGGPADDIFAEPESAR